MADREVLERLAAIEARLEYLQEEQVAEYEFRTLGHRVVYDDKGNCNLPGMASLSGSALKKQIERQKKFYGVHGA